MPCKVGRMSSSVQRLELARAEALQSRQTCDARTRSHRLNWAQISPHSSSGSPVPGTCDVKCGSDAAIERHGLNASSTYETRRGSADISFSGLLQVLATTTSACVPPHPWDRCRTAHDFLHPAAVTTRHFSALSKKTPSSHTGVASKAPSYSFTLIAPSHI